MYAIRHSGPAALCVISGEIKAKEAHPYRKAGWYHDIQVYDLLHKGTCLGSGSVGRTCHTGGVPRPLCSHPRQNVDNTGESMDKHLWWGLERWWLLPSELNSLTKHDGIQQSLVTNEKEWTSCTLEDLLWWAQDLSCWHQFTQAAPRCFPYDWYIWYQLRAKKYK